MTFQITSKIHDMVGIGVSQDTPRIELVQSAVGVAGISQTIAALNLPMGCLGAEHRGKASLDAFGHGERSGAARCGEVETQKGSLQLQPEIEGFEHEAEVDVVLATPSRQGGGRAAQEGVDDDDHRERVSPAL